MPVVPTPLWAKVQGAAVMAVVVGGLVYLHPTSGGHYLGGIIGVGILTDLTLFMSLDRPARESIVNTGDALCEMILGVRTDVRTLR